MGQLRILISRPDRIGDVVLSTPIPRELKIKYPDCYIAVLLRSYTKDIYLNNPHVDAIIIYDPDNPDEDFLTKLKEIKKHKFTHALMLLPNKEINYMLFLAGIRTRIGSGHKFYQFITFTRSVSRNNYFPLRHEADYCMDLARKTGVVTENIDTEIHLTEYEKIKAGIIREKLAPHGGMIVGIHASSGGSAPNWTPEKYVELLHILKKREGIKVVITDNSPDKMVDGIEGVSYPNKKLTLRDSLLNFAALDILISASTGPMHIAAALKVKTLSLFCPMTACSPELWGPKGNKSVIIMPEGNHCGLICNDDPKLCRFEEKAAITCETVFQKTIDLLRS